MSGSIKGKHHTPEGRAKMSNLLRERWKDPAYRERMAAMLREQAPRAVAIRDKGLPKRGTPEWRCYEKIRRILGPTAARAAL